MTDTDSALNINRSADRVFAAKRSKCASASSYRSRRWRATIRLLKAGFIRVIGKDIEVPVDGLTGQVCLKVQVGKQTFFFIVYQDLIKDLGGQLLDTALRS
ncbi:hypothetical protein [Desulfosarcina variabilis]|uniref:hypothetical protein n=1 Tax=Desulfosarcina variabilis TaxID=2300 RepID=UPI003AFB7A79